jgi:outer membrane receptor protein involved in Fe transport
VSVNRQLDGGRRQNLRASDPVTEDYASVRVTGYSGQASAHWGRRVAAVFGSDVYDEGIGSARWMDGVAARPLFPDKSRYRSYGTFGQGSWEVKPGRVRMGLGGRWTEIRFQSRAARLAFHDVSYNASLVWQARRWLGFQALGGRGFRAPNLNDLGAIGLNDLGYEIPAVEAIPAGALVGDSAGEGALSLGRRVERLRPEALVNLEFGARFTAERLYARAQVFQADLRDPIVRRTLLFPAEAAPRELAGLPVTVIAPTAGQRAQGVVAVATAFDPRATKAFVNDGQARYWGVESLLRYALSGRWTAEANYTFLAGRDLHPNRPIRRLSPQMGHAAIRYTRRGWAEVATRLAGAQRRLSGGDLDDERIGASRRRRDIADFFGGARVQAQVDGAGRYVVTGETLREIQERVLPGVDDSARVALYRATAGWATVALRAGYPLGERTTVYISVENMLDQNYRVHGSGVDAPGRNFYVGVRYGW